MDKRRNRSVDSFIERACVRGYKLTTNILKIWRKSIFSENLTTENPENTPAVTKGSSNLIREGGRTVDSGRVAAIIE